MFQQGTKSTTADKGYANDNGRGGCVGSNQIQVLPTYVMASFYFAAGRQRWRWWRRNMSLNGVTDMCHVVGHSYCVVRTTPVVSYCMLRADEERVIIYKVLGIIHGRPRRYRHLGLAGRGALIGAPQTFIRTRGQEVVVAVYLWLYTRGRWRGSLLRFLLFLLGGYRRGRVGVHGAGMRCRHRSSRCRRSLLHSFGGDAVHRLVFGLLIPHYIS
jgi:hypothetical protein